VSLVWATRGRSWGFRFLLDGGFSDPIQPYDLAFAGTEGEPMLFQRVGRPVALRFPDPLGRCDEAGRVIPHDVVVSLPLADDLHSVEDGLRLVWPRLANAYARVWDHPQAPSEAEIRRALGEF